MLVFAFVLAASSTVARDGQPPALLDDAAVTEKAPAPAKKRPAQTLFEELQLEPAQTKPAPAKPVDGTVIGVSALGGVAGIVGTAGLGTALVLLGNVVNAGDATYVAFYGTLVALPVGAGLGAGIAHSLSHGDDGFGAGLAGVAGTLAGAAVGGGLGYVAAEVTTPSDASYRGFSLFGGLIVGAGAGALLGAGVGPAVHAAVE